MRERREPSSQAGLLPRSPFGPRPSRTSNLALASSPLDPSLSPSFPSLAPPGRASARSPFPLPLSPFSHTQERDPNPHGHARLAPSSISQPPRSSRSLDSPSFLPRPASSTPSLAAAASSVASAGPPQRRRLKLQIRSAPAHAPPPRSSTSIGARPLSSVARPHRPSSPPPRLPDAAAGLCFSAAPRPPLLHHARSARARPRRSLCCRRPRHRPASSSPTPSSPLRRHQPQLQRSSSAAMEFRHQPGSGVPRPIRPPQPSLRLPVVLHHQSLRRCRCPPASTPSLFRRRSNTRCPCALTKPPNRTLLLRSLLVCLAIMDMLLRTPSTTTPR